MDPRRRSSANSSDHEAEEFHQPCAEDYPEERGSFNGRYSIPDCGPSNNPYAPSVPSFDCGQLVHNPPVDSGEPFGKQHYLPDGVTGRMHNVDHRHRTLPNSRITDEMWASAIAHSAVSVLVGSGDDNVHKYYGHEDKCEDGRVKPYFEEYDRASEHPKLSSVGVDDFSDSDASYEKSSLFYSKITRMLLSKPKSKKVEITSGAKYIIYADGFYRKGKGKGRKKSSAKGGYGVLLKRVGGESVLAKAGCALEGVSALYHTIEGIKNGLDIVSRYPDITKLFIASNSHSVNEIINYCFKSNCEGKCVLHGISCFKVFCEGCLEYNVPKDEHFNLILEFLTQIVLSGRHLYQEGTFIASYVERSVNRPADFLAKMELSREYEPPYFPEELKRLIAGAGEYYYWDYT
ncbi:hypothetical protein MKW98_012251 [Papaver atlanticum]|uniref:Uncharacterized protein n=1 Tax=Papaver atlanticum TaxID=357466 RepID=A0AAD4T1M3_9MAGN|nr:hypothetical protein MKW98_012251 [Papaver atlanticum]